MKTIYFSIYYYQTRAKPGASLQAPLLQNKSASDPFSPMALRRHHAQMVRKGASSNQTNYVSRNIQIASLVQKLRQFF